MESSTLNDYLSGAYSGEPESLRKAKSFWSREPKLGIAKSRYTGSSKFGHLYRVEMYRFLEGISLGVQINSENLGGYSFSSNGFFKLGGEGKSVSYSISDNPIPTIKAENISGNKMKIYLATPAIFDQEYEEKRSKEKKRSGWIPKGINPETMEGTWKGIQLKILTVALGRYIPLGGFDMKNRHPKPMRRAVPSGTVYFVEVKGDIKQAVEAFNGKCISEELSQQGFGLAFTGSISSKRIINYA